MSEPRPPPPLARYQWQRHPANPVLPPDPSSSFDSHACMTPIVVPRGDEYWLYYSGGNRLGQRQICLAIAPRARPGEFRRLGLILGVGQKGDFDGHWMVCPRVFRVGERWLMIYTALPGGWNKGLQSIAGLGMAESSDGLHWKKLGNGPAITGDQHPEYPGNKGIGGGGPPLAVPDGQGGVIYRLYHSLAVGTPSRDRRVDQEKLGAVCHSRDGVTWTDHRIVLRRRNELTREDCGVNYPMVWRDGDLFRTLHCCIGTRWGAYSIAEAVSYDGYDWYRGTGGDDNLAIAPTSDKSWEGEMTCYPSVVPEDGQLRVYYNGNRYGGSGVGMAVASLTGGPRP